jgi:hypothetical protein
MNECEVCWLFGTPCGCILSNNDDNDNNEYHLVDGTTTPPTALRPETGTRPRRMTTMTPTRLHLHPKPSQIVCCPSTRTQWRRS